MNSVNHKVSIKEVLLYEVFIIWKVVSWFASHDWAVDNAIELIMFSKSNRVLL